MIDNRLNQKLAQQSIQTTRILLVIAVFLWLFWIAFDIEFAPDLLHVFIPIRITFALLSLIGIYLISKSRIKDLLAQLIFFIPPLATVAFMFNVVPKASMFIYFIGATMVLIIGFITLIIPPIRIIIYGLTALLLIPLFHLFFDQNSYSEMAANGGFVYLSICLFGMGLAFIRYANVKKAALNELLLHDANAKLIAQSSQLMSTNQELNESIKERNILLKEVHHRVKNNLQIISSLVKLQEDQIDKHSAKDILQLCQDRIRSLAIIHECLYQTEDFSFLDFENYVTSLAEYLSQSYDLDSKNIKVDISVNLKSLDMIRIVPCGLIINEAFTNAIKHAFDDEGGTIKIMANHDSQSIILSIEDNGKGIEETHLKSRNDSLGLTLINGLAGQLKGVALIEKLEHGTKVEIKFPYV